MGIHRLIHKGASLKFFGEKLNISLSMGLFSSNDIDSGSKMLLKSLASEVDFPSLNKALDIGTGTGVLALALKKKAPSCEVIARDRDALALSFTEYNRQVNKISKLQTQGALFLENLGVERFDLILSNIPAKAGERVISHFLSQSVRYLSEKGRCAVVIVSPLRELTERVLNEKDYKILFQEHNSQYSVFHYQDNPANPSEEPEDPGLPLYFRQKLNIEKENVSYKLTSAYNLPDFDEISWKDQLLMENLKGIKKGGSWLIHNPGQGHLLSFLIKRQMPKKITLAGRDLLQLRVGEHNARENGYEGEIILQHCGFEEELQQRLGHELFDFCHFDIQPVVRSQWEEPFRLLSLSLLAPGGYLSWLGKSAHIQALVKNRKGTQSVADRKFRGWRSVLLKSTL